jgi:hypothetical protein
MSKNNHLIENNEEIFAPEYSNAEKVKFIIKQICFGVFFLALSKFFIIPFMASFASNAHNIKILGVSGTTILLIGIFLGMPILSGLVMIPMLKIGIQSIIHRQYPPRRFKVFKKTKIIKGKKAIAKAVIILLLYFVAIIPVTIFGYISLNTMLNNRNIGK